MTLKIRPGDRVRLTLVGTVVQLDAAAMFVQPDHLPAGMVACMSLQQNLPITEVLSRAGLPVEEAQAGDRVRDDDDDWATVLFNDHVGRLLLVVYDGLDHNARMLRSYDYIEHVERPTETHAQAIEEALVGYGEPHNPAPGGYAHEVRPDVFRDPLNAPTYAVNIEADHDQLRDGFFAECRKLGLDDTAARDAWERPNAKSYDQLQAETKQRAHDAAVGYAPQSMADVVRNLRFGQIV